METQEITPEIAKALGLASRRGAVVTRVQAGSPAAAAGLRAGDVITAIDGRTVTSRLDLHNAEGLLPVGKAIRIDLQREGKTTSVSAALKARPKDIAGVVLDERLDGATFSELPERYRSQGVAGVLVSKVEAGSRAAANGLRTGDLISGLNQREFADLAGMQAGFSRTPERVLLTLTRGRRSYFVPME